MSNSNQLKKDLTMMFLTKWDRVGNPLYTKRAQKCNWGERVRRHIAKVLNFVFFVTGSILRWTPSHTATGPWPPPAPYYPPEWRSQLEEGARREQEKVEIDEVEATNMNGQLKTSKAPITLCF